MGKLFLLGIIVGIIGFIAFLYLWEAFSEVKHTGRSSGVSYDVYQNEVIALKKKIHKLENRLREQEEVARNDTKDRDALDRDKDAEIEVLRKRLGRIAELCPGYEKVISPDFKGRIEVVSEEKTAPSYAAPKGNTDGNNVYYLFDQETKRMIRSGLRAVIAENRSVRSMYDSVMDGRLRNAFNTELSIRKIDVIAEIKSTENIYTVTLCSCTCPDFEKRGKPCKHMLFLAYSLGVLQAYPEHIDESLEKLAKFAKKDRFGYYY